MILVRIAPPELEYSSNVGFLSGHRTKLHVVLDRLNDSSGLIGISFTSSSCKMQKWLLRKLNLILATGLLDEADRLSYLSGCISPFSHYRMCCLFLIGVHQFE